MHLTMANPAASLLLLMYIYSAHVLLSLDHLRSTNTPLSSCSRPIKLSGDHPIFTTVCWHTNNQSNTTTTSQHVQEKHICKKPILPTSTVKMEGGSDVLQGNCIRRSSILQLLVSIILHIQHRNRYPFHRSHGRCKKGRLFIAVRIRGTLKQCQVFCHRAHQDEEEISTHTREVFNRGRGCKVRRTQANNMRTML
jgi:hypothetical protein